MEHEALKLALEGVEIHSPNLPEHIVCAALIEALAQPAQNHSEDYLNMVAEPEQEPVGNASYLLADKVREALDRKACPDEFMRIAYESIIKNYTAPPQRKPLTDEQKDAERYRAIKTRHAYLMVTRLIGGKGYNSATAKHQIDAYADSAIEEIAAYNSMSDAEKQQERDDQIAELKAAPG